MLGWDPGRGASDETIGSDRLISLTRPLDEGRRYFSLDGLRSVTNLTDDLGNAVASYHLDAWGNFRFPDELNDSANRFAFTGHIFDTETGLYHAKARYFDPKLGRFLTQDSYLGQIDEPPSLHRYLYANDNPTRYIDPTGHMADAATIKNDFEAARRDVMSPEERRAATEREKDAQRVGAAWASELGKSIFRRIGGLAHTVMEATGMDEVVAVPARVIGGESLGQALENVAVEKIDPKGRIREARARGAGVLETAVQGATGLYDAGTDKVPIVGPLKIAFNSEAPLADRVEGALDATSQAAGLAAGGMSLARTRAAAPSPPAIEATVQPAPVPGDASFIGPLGNDSWVLSQRGQGAHLFERANVEGRANLAEFDRPYTPRYYPEGTAEAAGRAHLRLHQATRAEGIKLRGGIPETSDPSIIDSYGRAYSRPDLQGIRGTLRTPNGQTVVGSGLTPSQAWDAVLGWFAEWKSK